MRPAKPTERAIGIDHYVSDADGIGGRLRASPEAFRVEEIERFDTEPVDADTGPYPHVVFRATLRDWETNDFASALSDRLGISRERVSWAGTKDKRAVTTQLFSVQGVDPARIEAIDPSALDGASISVLGRAGRAIEFGDLAGNRFEITVGDASGVDRIAEVTADLAAFGGAADSADEVDPAESADEVDPAESTDGIDPIDHTATIGVPNYFGQQRFGSLRPITHEVGLAVVRGEWEQAVRTYVADAFESEPGDTREAREIAGDAIEDRDWSRALDALPHRLGYERSMIHSLAEESGNGSGAVDSAAFRTALEAVPSSLQRLFVHAAQSYAFNRILSERIERGLPFDEPVEGDVACFADRDAPERLRLPDVDRSQRVTGNRVGSIAKHCKRGRAFVTAPLVGTETELGNGTQGEIERSVLDELELSPEDFALPGDWASTGTRRAMLVTTDLTVQGDPPTFEFALPKGAYATVVLREYLKADPVDLG